MMSKSNFVISVTSLSKSRNEKIGSILNLSMNSYKKRYITGNSKIFYSDDIKHTKKWKTYTGASNYLSVLVRINSSSTNNSLYVDDIYTIEKI